MSADSPPVSADPPPPSQNGSAVLRDDANEAASPSVLPAAGPKRCCECNANRNKAKGSRCRRKGKKRGCDCLLKGKKCTNCHSCDLGICENRDPADKAGDGADSNSPSTHPRGFHADESSLQGGSGPCTAPLCAGCHTRPASTSKGLCFACLNNGVPPPYRPPPGVPLSPPDDPPPSSFVQEKLLEAYGTSEFNQRSGLHDTDYQRWHARLAPLNGCL